MNPLEEGFLEGCLMIPDRDRLRRQNWLLTFLVEQSGIDRIIRIVDKYMKVLKHIQRYIFEVKKHLDDIRVFIVLTLSTSQYDPRLQIKKFLPICDFFVILKLDVVRRFCCIGENTIVGPYFFGFSIGEQHFYRNTYSLLTKERPTREETLTLKLCIKKALFNETKSELIVKELDDFLELRRMKRETIRLIEKEKNTPKKKRLMVMLQRSLAELERKIKEFRNNPYTPDSSPTPSPRSEIKKRSNNLIRGAYNKYCTAERFADLSDTKKEYSENSNTDWSDMEDNRCNDTNKSTLDKSQIEEKDLEETITSLTRRVKRTSKVRILVREASP